MHGFHLAMVGDRYGLKVCSYRTSGGWNNYFLDKKCYCSCQVCLLFVLYHLDVWNELFLERIMYQIIENPQIACSPCNLYYQYLYKVPGRGVVLFCFFLFQVQWFWCWWGAGSKVLEPEIQCFLTSCVNSFWVASAGSSSEKCINLLLPQRLFKDNFSMLCQFIS